MNTDDWEILRLWGQGYATWEIAGILDIPIEVVYRLVWEDENSALTYDTSILDVFERARAEENRKIALHWEDEARKAVQGPNA